MASTYSNVHPCRLLQLITNRPQLRITGIKTKISTGIISGIYKLYTSRN